eukprot:315959-Rhodomonas_salina.1
MEKEREVGQGKKERKRKKGGRARGQEEDARGRTDVVLERFRDERVDARPQRDLPGLDQLLPAPRPRSALQMLHHAHIELPGTAGSFSGAALPPAPSSRLAAANLRSAPDIVQKMAGKVRSMKVGMLYPASRPGPSSPSSAPSLPRSRTTSHTTPHPTPCPRPQP